MELRPGCYTRAVNFLFLFCITRLGQAHLEIGICRVSKGDSE